VRVSEPPPFGLTFDDSEFREDLSAIIAQFRPDLLIIDPWNAAARDEKARNYQDTFNLIRQVVPAAPSTLFAHLLANFDSVMSRYTP
jgi:LmbE family N-acetylglucosaminyl deacetylase